MVQKSGWIFTTNQQTQNNMPHLRQTTHGIVLKIYWSLLKEEWICWEWKCKKNALKIEKKKIARIKIPQVINES